MRTSTLLSTLAVAAPAALAQSSNMTACDKYAMALFKGNNATTQYTLLTALVNTAVIGNYTTDPAPMNPVTGILNNGTVEGRPVSLLKYFDGMLASSNRGGSEGVAVNFLDGGGADPLKMNKPANGTDSNQYFLLTHLYEYFGALLNCTAYGKQGFPAYDRPKSQYEVHKFMDLSHDEVTYFITQVGAAATSFGVTKEDVTVVANALGNTFNYKCLPETTVIPAQGPQLQSICTGADCPTAPMNATCAAYQSNVTEPVAANGTNMDTSKPSMMASGTAGSASGTGSMSGSASATGSSAAGSTGAAAVNSLGAVLMGVAGLAALAAGL